MADPAVYNAILESNKILQDQIQTKKLQTAIAALQTSPFVTSNWSLFPLLSSPAGCLCVVDNSGNNRCGASCTWTVPAGVTRAQFQIWGPGGGTGSGCCCGGSPFGATGAFATVILPVTAGCQYVLCAGCAVCCYACRAQHNTTGSSSFVTGFGLTNFCAMGGYAGTFRRMQVSGKSNCRYQNVVCQDSGPCICNTGTDYCFSNSCATCGCIPFIADSEQTWYGTATGSTVLGMPSVLGSGCLDTNNYGYHEHPPVIGPCHTAQPNSCCCFSFSSSTCGGCQCGGQLGVMAYPGAGGFATHIMGGCTSIAGDAGRGGMVRVTWC